MFYLKKFFYILVLCLLLPLFFACKDTKDSVSSTENKSSKNFMSMLLSDSLQYTSFFQVAAQRLQNGNTEPQYTLVGWVSSPTIDTLCLNGGSAIIHGVGPFLPDSTKKWLYGVGGPMFFNSSMTKPIFGVSNTWCLSGDSLTGVPGFNTSMYIPQDIYLTSNITPGQLISQSNNLDLQWNVDANNQNGVLIFLSYLIQQSQEKNPNLPGNLIQWYQVVSDNGEFVIPASVLQQFPQGGYISLNIGRANNKNINSGSFNFSLLGYTYISFNIIITQ